MSGLPPSFSYYVNRLSSAVKKNTLRLVPRGSANVKQNGIIEFDLPSDAIINLDSLEMRYNFYYTNAVGGTAGVRAVVPPHLLFRSAQWYLNGQAVAGQNNQYFGHTHEIMKRCTGNEEHNRANMNSYQATPTVDSAGKFQGSYVAGTGSGNGQRCVFKSFGGLQNSPNSPNMDSAVVGQIRLRLDLNGNAPVIGYADSGTNDNDWELDNVEMFVETITFLGNDNVYDQALSSILANDKIYIPFPEVYTQLSSATNNTKFNISTQSLDLLGWAPLLDTYNQATQMASTSGAVANANCLNGANFCRFRLRNSAGNVPAVNSQAETYYWNFNAYTMPASGPETVRDGCGRTIQIFSGGDMNVDGTNLLFRGVLGNDGATPARGYSYMRENLLNENAIVFHKLCLDVPASQSPNRTLSGINTSGTSSQISLQLSSPRSTDYVLVIAQTSAVLAVGAGQTVDVVY